MVLNYAFALTLFIETRPRKCIMSVYPNSEQVYRLLLSSTRILTTSVRTATTFAVNVLTESIKIKLP